jgi:hypothetical protein
MKIKLPKNIDTTGRWIRAVLGLLLLAYAYWKMSAVLAFVALFVLFEAWKSWCVIYHILGKNSCSIKRKK